MSGEYFGRKRNQAPRSARAFAARGLLWTFRLSRMPTSPQVNVGASCVRTYASTAAPSLAPSMVHGSPRPFCRTPALTLSFLHFPLSPSSTLPPPLLLPPPPSLFFFFPSFFSS